MAGYTPEQMPVLSGLARGFGMIHASQLRDRFANFHTLDQFLDDAEHGRLPTYSFIEPNLLHGHNDMHPSFNSMFPGLAFDAPSSLLGGEALLAADPRRGPHLGDA